MILLNESIINESYEVLDISGAGPWILRLKSLGIEVGSEIFVRQKLPFNGPIIIQVLGTTLALRRGEASCIKLRQKT